MLRICCVLYCICALFQGAVSAQVRDAVRQCYLNEIGVKEATGNNDGERVELYLRSCGLPKGNPWCAAFTNWCLKQNAVKTPNSGYCPSWFPSSKIIYTRGKEMVQLPQKGDLVGFYFAEKKRIAHIGFVDEWGEKYVITVEGNTNDYLTREGNGVYRNKRSKRQIYTVSRWIKD